jgi:hypothetical protein
MKQETKTKSIYIYKSESGWVCVRVVRRRESGCVCVRVARRRSAVAM